MADVEGIASAETQEVRLRKSLQLSRTDWQCLGRFALFLSRKLLEDT